MKTITVFMKRFLLLCLALLTVLGCCVTGYAAPVSGTHTEAHAPAPALSSQSGGALQAPLVSPQIGGGTARIPVSVIITTGKFIGKNAFLGYKLLRGATEGASSWNRGGSITDVTADALSGFTGVRINNVDTREMYVEIQKQFESVHAELGDLSNSIKELGAAIDDLKSDLEKFATQITVNDFKSKYVAAYTALNTEYLDLHESLQDPKSDHESAYKQLYVEALNLHSVVYPYLNGSTLAGSESILDVMHDYATHTESPDGAVASANAIAQEIYGAYVFAEYCMMTCELYQANICVEKNLSDYYYTESKSTPRGRYVEMIEEARVRQIAINNRVCSFIAEVNLDNSYVYNPKGTDLYINYPATVMKACTGDRLYFYAMPEMFDGIFNPDGFTFRVSDPSLASVTQSGAVEVLGESGSFTVSLFYRAEASAAETELYRLTINITSRNFSGGFGTADAPYVMTTPDDVKHLLEDYIWYNSDSSICFALYNDIDMGGSDLKPLRTYPFVGTLDGNGFSIYNFILNTSGSSTTNLGLIDTNSGVIRRLKIGKSGFRASYGKSVQIGSDEGRVSTDEFYTGAICAVNTGTIQDCVIENVLVQRVAQEHSDNKDSYVNVGAIAGKSTGTVERCVVRNTTVRAQLKSALGSGDVNIARAGGLIGYMGGGTLSESLVIDSDIKATSHASGSKGLFGLHNEGEGHSYAGGLIARITSGTVNHCVSCDTPVVAAGVDDNEYNLFTLCDGGIVGERIGGTGTDNQAVNSGDDIAGVDTSNSAILGGWSSNSYFFLMSFKPSDVLFLDANERPMVLAFESIELSYGTVKTQYKKNEAFNPVGIYAVTVDSKGNRSTQTVPFVRVDASKFGASGGKITVSSWGGLTESFDAARSCDHTWDEGRVTASSTHTVNGTKVYTCSECGGTQSETLALVPHTYDQRVMSGNYLVSEATCLSPAIYHVSCSCGKAGSETFTDEVSGLGSHDLKHYPAEAADCTKDVTAEHYVCNTCKRIFRDAEAADEVTDPADLIVHGSGHSYSSKNFAPTCTENGYTLHICGKCGHQYKDNYLFADGHDEVIDAATPATCTKSGLTAGRHCSTCGEILVAQTVIPAKGHTEVIQTGKAATCTETGLTEGRYCSVCDAVFATQTEIPALGHNPVVDPAREETCTEVGLTEGAHCSRCGLVYVAQNEIPARGHRETDDAAQAPTCTQNGLTAGKHCMVCGAVTVKQEPVAALGHKEALDPAVPATCTESGLSQGKHCTVCLAVTLAQNVVPALGHTELISSAVPPTCLQSGLTEGRRCHICGVTTLQQTTIPALGHTEVIDAAQAPTCTKTGLTEGRHCETCGQVFVAQTTVPAKGHGTISDWTVSLAPQPGVAGEERKTCTDCGEVMETRPIDALPIETESATEAETAQPSSDGCSGLLGGYSMLAMLCVLLGATLAVRPRKRKQ